ncbi:MAG: hypothetical protein QY308_09530 [Ignavibacteriaceae bacterium]|nr:MAG: hypothetical protein QY308_09530 [Ignavibacteriaceae bacterium]
MKESTKVFLKKTLITAGIIIAVKIFESYKQRKETGKSEAKKVK